jgi:hypothetical protein
MWALHKITFHVALKRLEVAIFMAKIKLAIKSSFECKEKEIDLDNLF